jgi:dTDP-4-dehydrorhamnose reductase
MVNDAYTAEVKIERDEELKIDRSLDSRKLRAETGFAPASWREMIRMMADDAKIYGRWKQ